MTRIERKRRNPHLMCAMIDTESSEVMKEIRRMAGEAASAADLQRRMVDFLHNRFPDYNWVGFYMLDPNDPAMLVLGPYAGAPTPHTRIPITQGICGAAVAQRGTVVVDDVSSDPRYLSCSIETKSEIVVPIYADAKIVGEIDIDSHRHGAFGSDDRIFLEDCAELVGRFIERRAKDGVPETAA